MGGLLVVRGAPVAADPPANLDSDLALFEWGIYEEWEDGGPPRLQVDLVRQFALVDEDGDYDHMEQLRCTLHFPATPELRELGTGAVWSDDDLWSTRARRPWIAEVEGLDAFATVIAAGPALAVGVEQEEV